MRGVVKTIQKGKRFGFIRGSDGIDYFFHERDTTSPSLIDDFDRGQAVEFHPTHHEKGPRAIHVSHV